VIGGELQQAIYAALVAGSIAGGRIYDRVPAGAMFPYVTIGDEQVLDDGSECMDAWEVISDVHVWSRPDGGSKLELKALVAEIVPRLATTLTVSGFRTVVGDMQTVRSFRDPDGLTEHAVLSFRFLIDPA